MGTEIKVNRTELMKVAESFPSELVESFQAFYNTYGDAYYDCSLDLSYQDKVSSSEENRTYQSNLEDYLANMSEDVENALKQLARYRIDNVEEQPKALHSYVIWEILSSNSLAENK